MVTQTVLSDGLMRRAPGWAELVLVVAMAWFVSNLLVPVQDVEQREISSGALSQLPLPSALELAGVTLFGRTAKDKSQTVNVPKNVAVSHLDIKLLGTVVADQYSAAIIKLASETDQHIFFVGDAIKPGIRLHAVLVDSILIDRAGKLEKVKIQAGVRTGGSPVSFAPQHSAAVMPKHRQHVDRPFLQNQIQDFPKLLSQARVTPHFLDGKADGFVITDIVPGSLYQKIGLMNGDIIRRVNGQQIISAQQAMSMYQGLQNSSSINVELMRAGQVQNVHYDID